MHSFHYIVFEILEDNGEDKQESDDSQESPQVTNLDGALGALLLLLPTFLLLLLLVNICLCICFQLGVLNNLGQVTEDRISFLLHLLVVLLLGIGFLRLLGISLGSLGLLVVFVHLNCLRYHGTGAFGRLRLLGC